MFLAPLNYDKYFNKVFSSEKISKRFLEDFLEANIKEFEMLKGRHRVTDDAALVEFDFRCKVENSFVILDMQQWYRRDTNRRFYLYHALNTGLQLEELPDKRVLYDYSYQKTKKVKDYRYERGIYEDALEDIRKKGREKFKEEGIKEGEKKKAKEIAKKMKTLGFSIEKISEITNLSKEEIDKL